MKISGIYAIKNLVNGKTYVGQTVDLNRRLYDHKRCLKKDMHHNIYLQREYNKYGFEKFEFTTLEQCDVELLDEKEIYWINKLKCTNNLQGYNMEGGGNKGKFVTEETRKKKIGSNNPMYGKKLSASHIQSLKIKNRANSKLLTESDVYDIKDGIANSVERNWLAERYNVARCTIDKIANCNNWEWVHKDINYKLKNIQSEYKKNRDKQVFELNNKGLSRAKISKIVGCTESTVTRILGKSSKHEKEERDALIVDDYKRGISKAEIIKKYSICNSVYTKAISEEYNKKINFEKKQAINMRDSGMMVKDIAEKLGYARTTISKWTR